MLQGGSIGLRLAGHKADGEQQATSTPYRHRIANAIFLSVARLTSCTNAARFVTLVGGAMSWRELMFASLLLRSGSMGTVR